MNRPRLSNGDRRLTRPSTPIIGFPLQVEESVLAALATTAKDGFPTERIDAELHQLQLHARHVRAQVVAHTRNAREP